MYLSTFDPKDCCGCGGCQQVCPTDCVTMAFLDDGFFYPILNQNHCIDCGKCTIVCPFERSKSPLRNNNIQHCYFAWHKNEFIRNRSTSGGVFSAIAEFVLKNQKSAVYGALYDVDWSVCHKGITSPIELDKLRQSKYAQSNLDGCFSEIRDRLTDNEYVLFCGTPCQVDALQLFLERDHEKLLLVDFICHGVTSPQIFKKYILSLAQRQGSPVKRFRFRDKVTRGNASSLSNTTIVFEDDKIKSSQYNIYLNAYMKGLMQRESCEHCPYASSNRCSDVTLGDFWGIEEIFPTLKEQSRKGISLILSNTEKGHKICMKLADSLYLVETAWSFAFNGKNEQLSKPVLANNRKRHLYSDVRKVGVQRALAKHLGIRNLVLMQYAQCISLIKAYLPKEIYNWLLLFKRSLCR